MKHRSSFGKLRFLIDTIWKTVIVVTMAACIIAAVNTGNAYAGFPNKPLTIIVPYKAGGSTDTMIRVYAKALADHAATADNKMSHLRICRIRIVFAILVIPFRRRWT